MLPKENPKSFKKMFDITYTNYGLAMVLALTLMYFTPWWLLSYLLYSLGIVYLTSIFEPFVSDWRPKSRVSSQGKAVFISGCDSGFGHLLAKRLDDKRLTVFAGCLFPDKDGAQTLKRSCSSRLHIVPLNVTSDDSIQKAFQYVIDNIGEKKLWALVNNAGINAGGEIMWTGVDVMQSIFDVNTLGVVRLTKTFLPLLLKNEGRVITVSSFSGRNAFPVFVPYSMSKSAVISFCDGLRRELQGHQIKIILVEPCAYYSTGLLKKENIVNHTKKTWNESPEKMKEMFPETQLEKSNNIFNVISRFSSNNLQQVVGCLEEAITATDPKLIYSPGTLSSRFMMWVLCRLPDQFADVVVNKIFSTLKSV